MIRYLSMRLLWKPNFMFFPFMTEISHAFESFFRKSSTFVGWVKMNPGINENVKGSLMPGLRPLDDERKKSI